MIQRWIVPGVITSFLFFFDRFTKLLVIKGLPEGATLEVIPGFFNIVHVKNSGGVFGIAAGQRSSLLFLIASLVAIFVIISLLRKLPDEAKMVRWALAGVLAGGAGNLMDRIVYGKVIDFLDLHVYSLHWPAFNVADSCILIGLAFALWGYLRYKRA